MIDKIKLARILPAVPAAPAAHQAPKTQPHPTPKPAS